MHAPYSHRQIGIQSLIAHAVGIVVLAWVFFRVALVGVSVPMFAALAIMLVVSLVTFTSLHCDVDSEQFRARFGIFGWPGKCVPLADIAGALPTRTAIISGFGIRVTTRGWLYSVSGRDAVIVGMRVGKQFLIGTDEVIALAEAINQSLGRAPEFGAIRGATSRPVA